MGQLLGQPLEAAWYFALYDSPEEAQARHNEHAAAARNPVNRLRGYEGNN